jgi:hypothetical protein
MWLSNDPATSEFGTRDLPSTPTNVCSLGTTRRVADVPLPPRLSSRPEDFHLRALPEPYVNLSIHTAPDVRPLPWHSCQ